MFVLLEHHTPNNPAAAPAAAANPHWDLLLEVPGHPLLPTWHLAADPCVEHGEIPAERIQDHRPHYLDYEGEVSGQRGSVRRIDRGTATVERFDARAIVFSLDGPKLRGRFALTPTTGTSVLRRLPPERAPTPGA